MNDNLKFLLVTKQVILETIRGARQRLIYCAPGVDEDIANELTAATKRLAPESVYLQIDPSEKALRLGYGTQTGVEILAKLRKTLIANSWRLGLVIADERALIFTPTPEALEPPPRNETEPNGVIVVGDVIELLLQPNGIGPKRPVLEPKVEKDGSKAKGNGANGNGDKTPDEQKEQHSTRIPSPRERRKLAMVRRLFKVVRFHHSLNLADKKVRLTAREFGLKTKNIDPQLSISFNIVSDKHRKALKAILNGFDKEVERMTKGGVIKSLHPHGYVVWYADPKTFEDGFAKVRAQIEDGVTKWFEKNYGKVEKDSRALVEKFLRVDLFRRIKPEREPRHHGLSDEQFREEWVKEQALKFQLPCAAEVLKTLRISCDRLDISEQLLADNDFCQRLEKAFSVKLDELLEREECRN